MPIEKHSETYTQASGKFSDLKSAAAELEKQAVALKIIAGNLLSKAEDETLLEKLKRKIKGG